MLSRDFRHGTGALLAREYFDPGKGPVRLPTPALPGCSPTSSHSMCVRSLLWYSELDPVPESIRAVASGQDYGGVEAVSSASAREAPLVALEKGGGDAYTVRIGKENGRGSGYTFFSGT